MRFSITKNNYFLTALFILCSSFASSQIFTPGQSYFSLDGNIEYIAGDLPIIMSVPHGGYLTPSGIKDRNCSGCVYLRDFSTQEMAREIAAAVFNKSGCRIHVIINLLSRRKLDANREIVEAADGDPGAEASWYAYQSFIDTARQQLIGVFGKGYFIDLHGHGHLLQRAELGYAMSGSDLRKSDIFLNTNSTINRSTIKNLVSSNPAAYNHSELIRGPFSFGEMLNRSGYDAVPSRSDPAPLATQGYFSGGYTVQQQGSSNGGTIDAIQIECANSTRTPASSRKVFADSLASVFIAFLRRHYFPNAVTSLCAKTGSIELNEKNPTLLNYGKGVYYVEGLNGEYKYELINSLYQVVSIGVVDQWDAEINFSAITNGSYLLILKNSSQRYILKLIKYGSN